MNTIVETDSGKIQGYEQRGLLVFKGVPFAAPPVGKLRWHEPAPVTPWTGVRAADRSGPIAPQTILPSIFAAEDQPVEQEPQGEDCLYLNIWTPGLDAARRPVLFWIHGGGFTGGSGSMAVYKGSRLAAKGDAVVVTTNYRLGPLGFLNLNEVTGGRIPATGNEGLNDQTAALEWVHRNISSFGGDPGNVTIFGESAGGMSVGCQLVIPRAKGLFRRAILQSGATSTARSPQKAAQVAEEFLHLLGVKATDTAALYDLPPSRLLEAQQKLMPRMQQLERAAGLALQPVIDGKTLPGLPLEAVRNGAAADTPIVVGTNLDEWKIVNFRNREIQNLDDAGLVRRVERLLPSQNASAFAETYRRCLARRGVSARPADIFSAIETDQKFRVPAVRLCEAQRKAGGQTYSYLFTWPNPAMNGALGAHHALELGYLFGVYAPGPSADAISRNFQSAWLSFARRGEPGCETVGKWPQYGDRRATMLINEVCRVENAPYDEERRAWDTVPDEELGS